MSDGPNEVERTTRSVIERKLLDACSEEDTVAILATRADVELLIHALAMYQTRKSNEFANGLKQLLREAFPND